ncbi:porin family protein [Algibacter aquimarinus]|uniref:Outer membrane protein beta-barrel domain-containing protein n=1 Tax=Algibacter aquimarinus TaxID=1136748 RepID=A0ABP9HEC6_9FLAO
MKKISLLIILLSVSLQGFCQEDEKKEDDKKSKSSTFQGVKYGVRGGYNISNLDFDESPGIENKHRNSFYIGFFAEIGLSKTVSLMPEIQFSPEGAKAEVLHLDYLQAPVLIKFRLSEKLKFGLGPQVSLKIHKEGDGVKNFAYSGLAGIEYKLSHMLFADLRYTYGISDVFDDNQLISAKNSNIQIGIGYKF